MFLLQRSQTNCFLVVESFHLSELFVNYLSAAAGLLEWIKWDRIGWTHKMGSVEFGEYLSEIVFDPHSASSQFLHRWASQCLPPNWSLTPNLRDFISGTYICDISQHYDIRTIFGTISIYQILNIFSEGIEEIIIPKYIFPGVRHVTFKWMQKLCTWYAMMFQFDFTACWCPLAGWSKEDDSICDIITQQQIKSLFPHREYEAPSDLSP